MDLLTHWMKSSNRRNNPRRWSRYPSNSYCNCHACLPFLPALAAVTGWKTSPNIGRSHYPRAQPCHVHLNIHAGILPSSHSPAAFLISLFLPENKSVTFIFIYWTEGRKWLQPPVCTCHLRTTCPLNCQCPKMCAMLQIAECFRACISTVFHPDMHCFLIQ